MIGTSEVAAGSWLSMTKASVQLTRPATRPLLPAMNSASEAETLRVRLLSMAQQKQAKATARGPVQSCAETASCCQDSTTPPATMASMPITIRRSAFSLNTTHASSAVSTDSRLSISDALAPDVRVRPNISATGANTPPKPMAPSSHGHSPVPSPEGFQPRSRAKRRTVKPRPLPR